VIADQAIAVFTEDKRYLQQAVDLAADLVLPLVNKRPDEESLLLVVDRHGVSLVSTAMAHGPLRIDFSSPSLNYRRRFGGGRGQAIARAVGLKGGNTPRVLDATAGLGRDSFVLASLGCTVIMIERSTIMAALLADGLSRGQRDSDIAAVIDRMSLRVANAVGWINAAENIDFEVIYIDPMFPPRTNSALAKVDMQSLHKLLGVDEDIELLLSTALQSNASRVVVKRPKKFGNVVGLKPSFVLQGRSSRFDVYL
jgi:16S rRNA (guanine1516-N2)-methyltransferase